jgi:hypothetical protein
VAERKGGCDSASRVARKKLVSLLVVRLKHGVLRPECLSGQRECEKRLQDVFFFWALCTARAIGSRGQ